MGAYDYFIHPITDGIPAMDPAVLEETIDAIMGVADLRCDYLVAPEAMGIPLVVPVSLRTGIPYNVVRKRHYGLPGEVSVCQVTGYSRCEMYLNGLSRGDRVVILDDVLSTGGTIIAVGQALQQMGVQLVDVVVVVEKGHRREDVERALGMRIKTLVRVEVRGGRVVVIE